jgi:mobilization protein NikA
MKRPGRPPLDPTDHSVAVNVRLTARQYDAVYKQAQQARLTIPEWIRRRLPHCGIQTRRRHNL